MEYEKHSLRQLSKVLIQEFGKGFSRSNLSNMRQFYLTHKDVRTASGQLSWSHYCELQSISDEQKRHFYEKECMNARWTVRELRRQIESSLFERLLLSSEDANKIKVLELSSKGIHTSSNKLYKRNSDGSVPDDSMSPGALPSKLNFTRSLVLNEIGYDFFRSRDGLRL